MTNLINRLQLDLHFSQDEEAFSLRHNFAQTFQAQIEEVVDRVCLKYVSEDEWLNIDKLEINLGRFRPNGFRHNFAGVFLFHFERALTEKLSRITKLDRETSREMLKVELLEYFLQQGTLPWFAAEEEIDIEEISLEIAKHEPEVFKGILFKNRFKASFWKRIAFQMNDEVKSLIFEMFEELKDAEKTAIAIVEDILNNTRIAKDRKITNEGEVKTSSGEELSNTANSKGKAKIFIKNAEDRKIRNEEDLTTSSKEVLKDYGNAANSTNKAKIFKNTRYALLGEAAEIFKAAGSLQAVREIIQKHASFIFGEDVISINAKDGFGILKSSANFGIAGSSKDESGLTTKTNNEALYQFGDIFKSSEEGKEKLVVKHAGILLLSPFFYSFFVRLQLIKGIEWTSKEAQYKAVHLLKYLSTGRVKSPEFVLTLEKIFCGLAIHEPVPAEVDFSEDDIRESGELLESVIEHWKALKNTSVNGLREAFLKRDGIITRNDNGWLIRVERKTHDVLLESVPWGYSTISLSWAPYLVFVEW